ncbi:hypothetical protein HK097_003523, partial [Rhizophlyctis rosea]
MATGSAVPATASVPAASALKGGPQSILGPAQKGAISTASPARPPPNMMKPSNASAIRNPAVHPHAAAPASVNPHPLPPTSATQIRPNTPGIPASIPDPFQQQQAEQQRAAQQRLAQSGNLNPSGALTSQPPGMQPIPVGKSSPQIENQQRANNQRLQQANIALLQAQVQQHQSHMARNQALVGGPGPQQALPGTSPIARPTNLGMQNLQHEGLSRPPAQGMSQTQPSVATPPNMSNGIPSMPNNNLNGLTKEQQEAVMLFARNPEQLKALNPEYRQLIQQQALRMMAASQGQQSGGAGSMQLGNANAVNSPASQQQQQHVSAPGNLVAERGPVQNVSQAPPHPPQAEKLWTGPLCVQAVGPAGTKTVACNVSITPGFGKVKLEDLDRPAWPDKLLIWHSQMTAVRQDYLKTIVQNPQRPLAMVSIVPESSSDPSNNPNNAKIFQNIEQLFVQKSQGVIVPFGSAPHQKDKGILITAWEKKLIGIVFVKTPLGIAGSLLQGVPGQGGAQDQQQHGQGQPQLNSQQGQQQQQQQQQQQMNAQVAQQQQQARQQAAAVAAAAQAQAQAQQGQANYGQQQPG